MKGLIFLLIVLAPFFISCSSDDVTGKTEAEVLYLQAVESFQKERYLVATEKLGQLKSQYPYSYYATHAELLQADILFEQQNYVEATAAYLMFKEAHPKHEKMSYVLFKIAESYYKQLPSTFDRDLSSASEAIKYYQEVIERYPDSADALTSRERTKECQGMVLNKEKYIADFYYKTGVYDAALWRYLDIIKNIKDDSLLEHSKVRAILASQKLGKFSDCINYSTTFSSELSSDSQATAEKLKKECTEQLEKQKLEEEHST